MNTECWIYFFLNLNENLPFISNKVLFFQLSFFFLLNKRSYFLMLPQHLNYREPLMNLSPPSLYPHSSREGCSISSPYWPYRIDPQLSLQPTTSLQLNHFPYPSHSSLLPSTLSQIYNLLIPKQQFHLSQQHLQ